MELTYMVRGGDGKEYGPVTLEQVGGWIREGRLTPQQEVKRSDMQHWAPAKDFAELQALFGASAAPAAGTGRPVGATAPASTAQTDPALQAQLKSGASWFYWIAGLSLINSIAAFSGASFRFIFGLGITQILDRLARETGSAGPAIALVLDLVAAGIFVVFGVFANKGHTWAFIIGMILFLLDTVLVLIFQDWLGVGVHVFVILFLARGFVACRKLRPHNGHEG